MTDLNRNQHYEFWVSYYEELLTAGTLTDKGVEANNTSLIQHRWKPEGDVIPMQEETLCFQVLYPGLLIGLGNTHFSQSAEGEIKLGFTFDPVTGLPFLPGSSVKGLLRSAFLANRDYVRACLEEVNAGLRLSEAQVQELERDSFGRDHAYGSYENRMPEAGAGRDIFFDAYPVQPDQDGRLLGIEHITPHLAKKKELEGLTSPNPLSLFKVMPGVVMQFRFRLEDSPLSGGVTVRAADKKKLFQTILLDFGAGAKTNVGFGALKALPDRAAETPCRYLVQVREAEKTASDGRPARQSAPAGGSGAPAVQRVQKEEEIREGMILQGKVNGCDLYGNYYVTLVPGTRVSGRLDGRHLKREISVNDIVQVRVFKIRDGWDKKRNQPRKNYVLDLI